MRVVITPPFVSFAHEEVGRGAVEVKPEFGRSASEEVRDRAPHGVPAVAAARRRPNDERIDTDASEPPRSGAGVRRGHILTLQAGIGATETAIYLAVATLLVLAAVMTLVGTLVDVIQGADSRRIDDTGVFVLDRVLLLFIIAELLYTLRAVNFGGQVLVEPFLFIGLIAVVRKVLVVTAESEQEDLRSSDFVLQVGAFAALALVLAVSSYLLRRSASS
jgi:uncharacterized membrane protein (DUF373 family)